MHTSTEQIEARKPTHEQAMAGYAVACKFGVLERRAFDLVDEMFAALETARATSRPGAALTEESKNIIGEDYSLSSLANELGKMKWIGADDGWDKAVDAVQKRIYEIIRARPKSFYGQIAERNRWEHTANSYRFRAEKAEGELRAILAASGGAHTVLEGWKLVPLVPSDEMLAVADGMDSDVIVEPRVHANALYDDMLAAAPASPASVTASQPVEAVYFVRSKDGRMGWLEVPKDQHDDVVGSGAFNSRILYTHPTKAEAPVGAEPVPEKPWNKDGNPGKWFPVGVLGHPMREYAPGKWECADWPSESATPASASVVPSDDQIVEIACEQGLVKIIGDNPTYEAELIWLVRAATPTAAPVSGEGLSDEQIDLIAAQFSTTLRGWEWSGEIIEVNGWKEYEFARATIAALKEKP